MSSPRARALPLAVDGVTTIAAPCAVTLLAAPAAHGTVPAVAPAGALAPSTALVLRFAAADGGARRAVCVVDDVEPAVDGTERCSLRLVSVPAPTAGRVHGRTPVVLDLFARRIEAGGQRVPVLVSDVAPGGLGCSSFVLLAEGEFVSLDDLFGDPTGVLAQIVRVARDGDMWAYGAAFGNLDRAAPLVDQLLAAARAAAA